MTCLLVKQAGEVYTTGCGAEYKSKSMPDTVSGWNKDITCPFCCTRLVFHTPIESWEDMGKLVDLDDPTVAYQFHFSTKRYGFRWLIGTPLIYIYNHREDPSPCQAIPIQNFVPEILDRPATSDDAAAAAKAWVIRCADLYADDGGPHKRSIGSPAPRRQPRRTPAPPPRPVVPEGYDGALCAACGKIDEGDFMPSPTNMLEEICMTCLVKGSK